MIVDGLRRFIDSLSWTDIFHLGDVWDRAKRIFTDPIDRLISFGVGVVERAAQSRQAGDPAAAGGARGGHRAATTC